MKVFHVAKLLHALKILLYFCIFAVTLVIIVSKYGIIPEQLDYASSHSSRTAFDEFELQDMALHKWNRKRKDFNEFLSPDDVYSFPVDKVNCDALFTGDPESISKTIKYQSNAVKSDAILNRISNDYLIEKTKQCDNYLHDNHYILQPVSKEEAEFPLAFSILMYKDLDQVERLVRAIYRPQNYYCIHVDASVKPYIYENMKAFAQCFPNVFLSKERSRVRWATYTVLEPEIFCMKELLKYKRWKYFINLTGQEFPLHTNLDLVRILTILNGANIVGSSRKGFVLNL